MKKLVRFCVCIVISCVIGVLSGCYTTPTSSKQYEEIPSVEIETTKSLKNNDVSDKLVPLSTTTTVNELEFSDKPLADKRWMRAYILKDNKYGNEYIVIYTGDGVGITLRQRN